MSLFTRFEAMFLDVHDNMDLLKEELEFIRNGMRTLDANIKQKFIDFLLDLISRELSDYDSVDSESNSEFSDSSNSFNFTECEVSDTEISTDSEIYSDDEFCDCISTWGDENISSLDAEMCGARCKEEDHESSNSKLSDFEWEFI